MSEDGKFIAPPSSFAVLVGKSIDGGLLEDFNELKKLADDLSPK